ncbi:unnamed protein product [Blepharisma stoltei]|uniref:sn-1-specific diacylglycerol lipase n=1 Tax=Blepharisma stoltei TaxID=1481888 RepID=A0AAU9IDH7_9CILI|nr:unnamed protein product [Blepharisma stoltei]
MERFKKNSYKVVSASAAAIENVAKPAAKHSTKIMIEGAQQIFTGINGFFEEVDRGTHRKLSWLFNGLKKMNRGVEKLTTYSLVANYQDTMNNLNIVERGLNAQQEDMEKYFKKVGIGIDKSWAFSIENRETIREISEFIKESTKECKNIPYHKIWQYFMAFVIVQERARHLLWKAVIVPRTPDMAASLEEMAYYSRYATAIYGKYLINILMEKKVLDLFKKINDDQIFLRYSNTSQQDLAYSHIKSQRFFPGHTICLNHTRKSIILCIRGTMSVFDCMTDLKGEYTSHDYTDPFTGEIKATGSVHMGIMECAKNLATNLKPLIIEQLEKFPDYSLVIAGHSLGAGSTALLSLIWMSDPDIMRKGFKAFAYAPPAVVSENLNHYLKQCVMSCSHGNDLVVRCSFGAIKDAVGMIEAFHRRDRTAGIKASHIVNKEIFKGTYTDTEILAVYEDIKSNFTNYKLQPPGHIFQIYHRLRHSDAQILYETQNLENLYVGEFVEPELYYEIVYARTMLSDHMPDLYEKGLNFLVYGDEKRQEIECGEASPSEETQEPNENEAVVSDDESNYLEAENEEVQVQSQEEAKINDDPYLM